MGVSVKIGNDIITNVSQVRLVDGIDTSKYDTFSSMMDGYNVTFYVQGSIYTISFVSAGESVTAPATPRVAGYYFKGWSTGSGTAVSFPYMPTSDTAFYAIMETETIVGFTGLSNQTPGLTLTDDIANVAMWTTSVDSQYVNVSNPLDSYWPFSEIEEMTDNQDNVFVKFPKMWMKWIHKEGTDIVDGVKFANHQVDNDYFVSDAYLDRTGTHIVDYFAIGKYEASVPQDQNRLMSKSNKSVLVSITRPTLRTYARNNPNPINYQLIDIQILTIYNLLCMMYYRTQNIQDVYAGRTASSDKTDTGSCDGLSGMNGWNTSTYCVKMLGVENPYGNTAQWIDGVVFDTSTIYIQRCPSLYSDTNSNATAMGFSRPATAGKIIALRHGTSTETRSALYCSAVETGSYTTYVGDYCNYASYGVVLDNGGDFSDGTKAGLWFLGGHVSSEYYSKYIGGRLAYRPTAS